MWVSPIAMEDFLIVILSIPLIDNFLQMDLYEVYNLPALHPGLKVQFSYVLEGEYLAIFTCSTYAAMLTPHEIHVLYHEVISVFSILPFPSGQDRMVCICTFYQKLRPSCRALLR